MTMRSIRGKFLQLNLISILLCVALIGGLGLVLLVLVWRYLAVRVLNRQLSERNREIERRLFDVFRKYAGRG